MTYREHMERCAKEYLTDLLVKHNGCVRAAAVEAGVRRTNLYQILRKHGLPKERQPVGNDAWRSLGH